MNIGFNALGLKSNTGGVETYIYNVVKTILEHDKKNNYFLFVGKNTVDIFNELRVFSNLKIVVYPINTNHSVTRIVAENTLLNLGCIKHRLNLVHHFCNYIPRIFFTKSIVTIHDLGGFFYHENYPKFKQMHKYYKYMKTELAYTLKKANKVIAISEFTKSEILKYYPDTTRTKICVVGESLDVRKIHKLKNVDISQLGIRKPYILSVSVIRPHKNIDFLISVFNELKEKYNISHQLVIVGGIQLETNTFDETLKKSPYRSDIKYLGYIDNALLPMLYKNAECYVFPSLYEGFGIPLLEAMEYGIPIASSNRASLPEVGGKGCLYFNPYNKFDATKIIYKLINEKYLQDGLKLHQSQILEYYSWHNIATNLLKFYNIG